MKRAGLAEADTRDSGGRDGASRVLNTPNLRYPTPVYRPESRALSPSPANPPPLLPPFMSLRRLQRIVHYRPHQIRQNLRRLQKRHMIRIHVDHGRHIAAPPLQLLQHVILLHEAEGAILQTLDVGAREMLPGRVADRRGEGGFGLGCDAGEGGGQGGGVRERVKEGCAGGGGVYERTLWKWKVRGGQLHRGGGGGVEKTEWKDALKGG